MRQHEGLAQVYDRLVSRDLGGAIVMMESFLAVHPHQINTDRLYAISSDYQMMADYWKHGFKDPQLQSLYDNLLRRMYELYANINVNYAVRHSPYLSSLFLKAHMTPRDWSPQVIKEDLESFVSDVALLGLEQSHLSESRRLEIYKRHQLSLVELCDFIMTSGIWTDGFEKAFENILLSPTVDINDQQLLISCIMLSLMTQFDISKFRLLIHVYQKASDEEVRQRSLVGWAFSLDAAVGQALFPEEIELVNELLESDQCCRELVELQKQVIYCVNAEKDHMMIQSEIMPDIMRHNSFHFTRNGIEEQEEDALNDILHPDEAEQNLEKVEESFQKMVDMQKQGSDIYFGGFSQMKRFPFFNELTNWFVPFFIDHPDISTAVMKFKDNRFLKMMMTKGPFCNSDKYSFLLAFETVLNQIPQQIREMLDRGEAQVMEITSDETRQPAYIRRIYLQDMYRFFRLFQDSRDFRNIFDREAKDYLFMTNPCFSETRLNRFFNEVTAFLIKQKKHTEAARMLDNYSISSHDFHYYLMMGYLGIGNPTDCYAHALEFQPDNERALSGYARSLFRDQRYEEALSAYDRLLSFHPEKRTYLLNKSVCQTNLHQYDEAEKTLFRLNYESPDDENVNRVLAWTLTCDGKYEQAEKLYGQLTAVEKSLADDWLNMGYCLWFKGAIVEAADCFRRFLKETDVEKRFIIDNEAELLRTKGITEPELQMMLYVL